MSYEVKKHRGYIEILLSGNSSPIEILEAISELANLDPGKHYPDLWILAPEVQIPYQHYAQIAKAIGSAFTEPPVAKKSAIVAANKFRMAQFDLYRSEAADLPLDIKVFQSRSKAIEWLQATD